MNRPQRLWPLLLLVVFAPAVHADDAKKAEQKPAASAASTTPPPAKTPAPSADDEFLEFLGSVGEESDGEWIEFLSKTEIAKTTKAKDKEK